MSFINFWNKQYLLEEDPCSPSSVSNSTLTEDEKSDLWYIGGYTIKATIDKLTRLTSDHHGCNNKLLLLLETLKETDDIDDEATYQSPDSNTKEWFNAINRGGLTRCTNDFYVWITNVEKALKSLLHQSDSNTKSINTSNMALQIKDSPEVACFWEDTIIEAEFPEHMSQIQDLILDYYVNFRVHAYTNKQMEKYKLTKKKSIQKS